MKSESSLSKSADAAISRAIEEVECLADDLNTIYLADAKVFKAVMPRIRARLALATQRIHEYNAYQNALETK